MPTLRHGEAPRRSSSRRTLTFRRNRGRSDRSPTARRCGSTRSARPRGMPSASNPPSLGRRSAQRATRRDAATTSSSCGTVPSSRTGCSGRVTWPVESARIPRSRRVRRRPLATSLREAGPGTDVRSEKRVDTAPSAWTILPIRVARLKGRARLAEVLLDRRVRAPADALRVRCAIAVTVVAAPEGGVADLVRNLVAVRLRFRMSKRRATPTRHRRRVSSQFVLPESLLVPR